MINRQLIDPRSIVVVGASNDITKPGGKILKNLLDYGYRGDLYVVNPKAKEIQGVPSYPDPAQLPRVDLAILAIPAAICPASALYLAMEKGVRAFIVISAGFSEENEKGAELEHDLVRIMEETGSSLIGPNCIGVITTTYAGCFTLPVPKLAPQGVDFISGSGATAVYVMESAIPNGLTFSSIFSVGNSAQIGVEDVLEHLDHTFDPETSSRVKLLYMESVRKPAKLLKHATSLILKGCRIAAIKAGSSEAGSRAASSHTGALASPDTAVDALFRKAGIVRCYSRSELATMGALFLHKKPRGRRMAIITHAGGPAVMLTDVLSEGQVEVPSITGPAAERLLTRLHPGSSVANPIDVLATGGVEQMEAVIDCVENELDQIDGMCIIFGSPGLSPVDPVYDLIDRKMKVCHKPIYPILPSIVNARGEVERFLAKGRINFPDEVLFGQALAKSLSIQTPEKRHSAVTGIDRTALARVLDQAGEGYLSPGQVQQLLDIAQVARIPEAVAHHKGEAVEIAGKMGYPVVMKVVGPVHKTDVGGVLLNLQDPSAVEEGFDRLMGIGGAEAVLLQPMLKGLELFVGAKREGNFGHIVMIGLGGIFIEVLKDVQTGLAPLTACEVDEMIGRLRGRSPAKPFTRSLNSTV
ncbi:MAG: acetate--CoA ligase family protein [Bacteroidales bacterium]